MLLSSMFKRTLKNINSFRLQIILIELLSSTTSECSLVGKMKGSTVLSLKKGRGVSGEPLQEQAVLNSHPMCELPEEFVTKARERNYT